MRYVMSSKWSLTEHFEISDQSGSPVLDVRGKLGPKHRLVIHDRSGQEVAEIKKHLMSTAHEIFIGGQRVAEVKHEGFIGDHFEIKSSFGKLTAKGHFAGWDYEISEHHRRIAKVRRELSLREKFAVDIA